MRENTDPTTSVDKPGSSLRAWVANPWFAYLTILVIQLAIVGFAWRNRDLTSGDTSSYFLNAWRWYTSWQVHIAWSPLYTAFYGSLLYITQDPYTVTMLHRLLIVCAATLLVLAVLRRMLPAGIAWCIAIWWSVLPINFSTMYEVHLFSFLPVLMAWLAALSLPGRWGRGLCLGIFAASTVLVRGELTIACALFGLFCLIGEWRTLRAGGLKAYQWQKCLLAYALPLGAAVFLCGLFYWRSDPKFPELSQHLAIKHTLNMSQVFTYGYQQRHPETGTKSPWDEYQDIMKEHFGDSLLTLSQMTARNPRAVLDHFLWNLSLTPNGMQLLLFNTTGGKYTPDYMELHPHPRIALSLSILVGCIWCAGLFLLIRDRRAWWQNWIKPRIAGWSAMLVFIAVTFAIILTQRPRPSYLFPLSVLLMTVTGMSLHVLFCNWPLLLGATDRIPRILLFSWLRFLGGKSRMALALLAAVPLCILIANQRPHPQLLRTHAQRMQPFEELLKKPGTRILQGEFAFEIMAYVGKRGSDSTSATSPSLDYRVLREWNMGVPLDQFLDERGINLVHLDENMLYKLEHERADDALGFVTESHVGTWHLLACQDLPGMRWRLYQRRESITAHLNVTAASSRREYSSR